MSDDIKPVTCNLCGFTAEPDGGRFRNHNTSPEIEPSVPCPNSNRLVDHPMPVPTPNVAKPDTPYSELPTAEARKEEAARRQHEWTKRLTQRNLDKHEQARVDRARSLAGGDQEALDLAMLNEALTAAVNKNEELFLGGVPFEMPFDNIIPVPQQPYPEPQPQPWPPQIQPSLPTSSKLDVLQELRYMADKIADRAEKDTPPDFTDGLHLAKHLLEARIAQLLRQPW